MPLVPEDVVLNTLLFEGDPVKPDVARAVVSGDITTSIDGGPVLQIVLEDPLQKLVRNGTFQHKITTQVDGRSFKLDQIKKNGPQLVTTWESLAIAVMREHTEPVGVEANTMTRLEFAQKLLDEIGWISIHLSPGASLEVTKVALARGTVASSPDDAGVQENYFPGETGGSGTLSAVDVARYAASAGFSGENLVIAVAVAKAESGWNAGAVNTANSNGTQDYGLWQINTVHKGLFSKYRWQDPAQNAQMAFEVFKGSGWKAWSTYNAGKHTKYMAEARAAVGNIKSLQGVDTTKLTAKQKAKSQRERLLGGAEDTWACIRRIFAEINYRAYVDWDASAGRWAVYVGPDSGFTSTIYQEITEDTIGVHEINYDFDFGKAEASATITCSTHRWALPPGTALALVTTGLPNPWIVASVSRSIFEVECTVTAKFPEPSLPEPEPEDASGGVEEQYFPGIGDVTGVDAGTQFNVTTSSGVYAWPLTGKRTVTSGFSPDRGGRPHEGVDLSGKIGDPVYASRDGFVSLASGDWDPSGYGNLVMIDHRPYGLDNVMGPMANKEQTRYGHLSKIIVSRGMNVKKGQIVGLVGQTGRSSGPHLHFEIRRTQKSTGKMIPVNPLPYLEDNRASMSCCRE